MKLIKTIFTVSMMVMVGQVFGYEAQYKRSEKTNVANVYTICEDFRYEDGFDEKVAEVRWNFAIDFNLTYLRSETVEDKWAKGKYQIIVYPFSNHLIDFVIVKNGEVTTCRYFGNMKEDYTAKEYIDMMNSTQYDMLAEFYNHRNLKEMLAVFELPTMNR